MGMRVLIVEPEASVNRMITWILEEAGFDVEATDASDAAEREVAPDVTVVDTRMEGDCRLGEIARRSPVVALKSAAASDDTTPEGVAIVHVPFDAETLVETVRSLAGPHGGAPDRER